MTADARRLFCTCEQILLAAVEDHRRNQLSSKLFRQRVWKHGGSTESRPTAPGGPTAQGWHQLPLPPRPPNPGSSTRTEGGRRSGERQDTRPRRGCPAPSLSPPGPGRGAGVTAATVAQGCGRGGPGKQKLPVLGGGGGGVPRRSSRGGGGGRGTHDTSVTWAGRDRFGGRVPAGLSAGQGPDGHGEEAAEEQRDPQGLHQEAGGGEDTRAQPHAPPAAPASATPPPPGRHWWRSAPPRPFPLSPPLAYPPANQRSPHLAVEPYYWLAASQRLR